MTIQELFVGSNQALLGVIEKIRDNQWALSLPEGASQKPGTLRNAVQYHAYDDAWVPDILNGKTKREVGQRYEEILHADEVKKTYRNYNQRAVRAVEAFTDLDRVTHLSYGDFPARDYLQHIVSFRAFRTYDIAKLIGADTTLDPELVQGLLSEFSPVIEGYRQMGVFPPAIEVTNDASAQTKLLAMVGRA